MQNSKTQKFIDKYCEYIDKILGKWERHEDKFDIARFAYKAEFLHYLLKIDKKFDYSRGLFSIDLGYLSCDLSDFSHDPDFCRRRTKQLKERKDHVLECRRLALRISSPMKEIESGHLNKGEVTEEKLNDLLFALKQIQKSINSKSSIEEREGVEANRLVIDMGLICKWYPLAVKVGLISKNIKLPYEEVESDICNELSLGGGRNCSKFEIENNKSWIEKTTKLLQLHTTHSLKNQIAPENKSIPISISRMASLIGRGMTRKKIRSLMDSGYYRYEQAGPQDFVFDCSQFPSLADRIRA